MVDTLQWVITPKETRKSNAWTIILFVPFALFFFLWFVNNGHLSTEIYCAAVFLIGLILISFFINFVFPYRSRMYLLDSEGLTISHGSRAGRYEWLDFECFFDYYDRFSKSSSNDNIFAKGRRTGVSGGTFYLQKKKRTFGRKVFVLVYTDTDNVGQVERYLAEHVLKKQMTNTTDLGLISYEFR